MPIMEARIMPPNTGVPTSRPRELSGACRNHQGPQAKDKGERRHHDGTETLSRPVSCRVRRATPCSRFSLANSTIRMPFFAASPISTTMPIWRVKVEG